MKVEGRTVARIQAGREIVAEGRKVYEVPSDAPWVLMSVALTPCCQQEDPVIRVD